MKINHPLIIDGTLATIQAVLRDLAAQEGCDGEPYDEMVAAADYVDRLEALLADMRTAVESLHESHMSYIPRLDCSAEELLDRVDEELK